MLILVRRRDQRLLSLRPPSLDQRPACLLLPSLSAENAKSHVTSVRMTETPSNNPNQPDITVDSEQDVLTLRFTGENEDGSPIHELKAEQLADVLEGLTELINDFEDAGVFHNSESASETGVYVRPAREGSFVVEVTRTIIENWEPVKLMGGPTLAGTVWWATKSMRAEVENVTDRPNGNVLVHWSDKTVDEIPPEAWAELNKRKRKRKKQLRKIMAPLEDTRVKELDVTNPTVQNHQNAPDAPPQRFEVTKADYVATAPSDEVEESRDFFETKAQLVAIDFEDPAKWKIKTPQRTRKAVIDDPVFLREVANGLPLSQDQSFPIKVREDRVVKNGRTSTSWTVYHVDFRKGLQDDDLPKSQVPPQD